MGRNSVLVAAAVTFLEGVSWAYQDPTHKSISDQAISAVPSSQYPDIARYSQTISNNSHGYMAEGYAHGGPNEQFVQRELDWFQFDGGPIATWLTKIQGQITGLNDPSKLIDVYTELGYVSHEIEDQTSPPHTANIAHGMFDHFEGEAGTPLITPQVKNLSSIVTFSDLAQYYTDAFKDSKVNLPIYLDPASPVPPPPQYWPVCDPNYLGKDHTTANCMYGGYIYANRPKEGLVLLPNQDTFNVTKSPNIVPTQVALGVDYVAGMLESFSEIMPPFALNAAVSPSITDGSAPLTLTFHAMHNRVSQLSLTAKILRADGSDTGVTAFSNTPVQLSGGVLLPWEADISLPWTLTGLHDGTYQLAVVLTGDNTHNVSAPALSNTFTIDTSQPNPGPNGPPPPSGFPTDPNSGEPLCMVWSANSASGICGMTLTGGPAGFQPASVTGNSSNAEWGPWCPGNLPGGCYVETITSCAGKTQTYSFCVPTLVPTMVYQTGSRIQSTPITADMIANDRLVLTATGGDYYAVPGSPSGIANACKMIELMPGGQCQSSCIGGECGVSEIANLPPQDVGFSVSNQSYPNQPINNSVSVRAALVRPNGTGDAMLQDTVIACPEAPNACATTSGTGNVSFHNTGQVPRVPVSAKYSADLIYPLGGPLIPPSPPTMTASMVSPIDGISLTSAPFEDPDSARASLLAQVVQDGEFNIGGSTAVYFAQPVTLQITISSISSVSSLTAIYQDVGHTWLKSPTSAITFNTDGTVTLTAQLTQGGVYAPLYFVPDNLPPRTTIAYGDPVYGTAISPTTPIALSAVDDWMRVGDGLHHAATTTYSVDGGAFIVYTTSFTIATPGSHTIQYHSIDAYGNAESINSASVLVPSPPAPPTILANGSNPSPWSNSGIYTLSVTTGPNAAGILMLLGKACAPPQSNDDGMPLTTLTFQPPCLSQGSNPLYLWSMDYVGSSDYRTAASIGLLYDNQLPSSYVVSPSTASNSPMTLAWSASDPGADATPPTGSGVAQTILWSRHDSSDDGIFGSWQQASTFTSLSGSYAFNPPADGNYQFYTQAVDNAGNAEVAPDTSTVAKAAAFYDHTPPLITAVAPMTLTSSAAQIQWTTDDLTTDYVEYGTTTALGARVAGGNWGRTQSLILSGLPYPATIYYRLTAVNKTQLQSTTPIAAFTTPPLVILPTDPFGVVTSTQAIFVQVDNPDLSSGSFFVDGQSGTLVPGTTNVFQITLSTGLMGSQTLTINIGGYIYNTSFIVDTATRSVRLERLVLDAGGLMTSTQTTPGISMMDASVGEPVVGPPSDQSAGFMNSGQSRLYLGYYAGIDPVAPGAVSSLSASAGPGSGQITLAWTAPGNDAYVGTAMSYDLRYSTSPIGGDTDFNQATSVTLSTFPALAGTTQQALISGLADGSTYFFALKTLDGLLNESSISNVVSTATYSVARSTDQTGGHTTVTLISNVPGVNIGLAASSGTVPAVALATSAAAAQGLLFASPIYDIQSPLNPLPGGATIQFYYDPTGLDPTLQQQLRVYHLSANSTTWMLVADAAPVLSQDLLIEPVISLSLFAIMLPDHVPPQTSLTTQGGRQYLTSSGSLFTSTSTYFGLMARDPPLGRLPGVGVLTTEFRVDSATAALMALVPSTAVFQLSAGQHSIDYLSIDLAGNAAPLQSAVVAVDGAPPLPLVRVSTADGTYAVLADPLVVLSTSTQISIQLVDPLTPGDILNDGAGASTVSYSVDGGSFNVAGSSFSFSLGLGLHTLALVAQDNVGNVLDRSTTPFHLVVGDAEPPRTTLAINSPQVSAGALAAAYVSRQTSFTLTSVDDLSSVGDGVGLGVAFQQFYVDGSLWTQFADSSPAQGQVFFSTFSLATDSDGVHALGYLAQDLVQNRESLHVTTVAVDNTPPATQLLVSSPAFGAYVSSLTAISLTGIDPTVNGVTSGLALTRYRDNGGAFQAYASTFTLAEGAHELDFQSQDKVANTELLRSATIFVDATPPVTAISVGSPTYTAADGSIFIGTATPVTFAALDPPLPQIASGTFLSSGTAPGSGVSRIEVSIDSASFAAYFSTLTFAEGRHAVQYRAVDNVGNVEPTHTLLISVDATPPVVAFEVLGSSFSDALGNLDISTQTALGLLSVDPVVSSVASGVRLTQYQVGGDSFTVYAGTFTLAAPDGPRQLAFQATDNAGNTSLLKGATVFLDATAPITTLTAGAPHFASSGTVFVSTLTPFALASQDPSVDGVASGVRSVFVATSSGAFTTYTGTFTLTAPDGARILSWYAADNVGNAEAVKSTTTALDATPPVTALSLSGGRQFQGLSGFYASSDTRLVLIATDPVVDGVASGLAFTRWEDNSGAFQLYASTVALAEGSHAFGYQSSDNVQNLEVLRSTTVLIDATPPVSVVATGSPTYTAADGTIYVATTTPVAFTAADPALASSTVAGSGVSRIEISLDSAPFVAYSSAVFVAEGRHTFLYRSVDNVGNVEAVRSISLQSDATPPQTALAVSTPSFGGFVSSSTVFALSAVDPSTNSVTSGVALTRYRINGGAFTAYSPALRLSGADGAYTLDYQSLDNVGNAEVLRSTTVLLDQTPPVTTLALSGGRQFQGLAGFYASSDTRLVLSSTDPVVGGIASGVAFTRWLDNGGAFQLYASSVALAEGSHAFGYQSSDNVQNLEVLRSTTVLIDATPPVSVVVIGSPTFTAADGTISVATATPVGFTAADPALTSSTVAGSGVNRIEVSIDSTPFAPYIAALTFAEGRHTILYRAVDDVGNVEAAHLLALSADATPPVSSLVIGTPQFSLSSATVLVSSLTPIDILAADPIATDVASGVRQSFYAVDGGTFSIFAASFTLTAPDGTHVISFYSQDNVLNTEAVKSSTILLDATPPEAALLSPVTCDSGICRVVKGKFPVLGTARDLHFANYILGFAPGQNATTGYALIGSGAAAVSSGTLATWDASTLSGWQTLRLTATDLVGNVSVVLENVFVGDPGELLVLGNDDVFDMPQGVAADSSGNIYVADTNANRVAVFTATGAFVTAYGQAHGDHDDMSQVSTSTVWFNKPEGVAVDALGNIYAADTNNDRVLKLSATGQLLLALGRQAKDGKERDAAPQFQPGKGPGEFNKPSGVALDAAGNIYVADTNNNRVQVLNSTGAFRLAFSLPPLPAVHADEKTDHDADQPGLGRPFGIAVDAAGKIYVADPAGGRALVFGATGQLLLSVPITGTTKDGHAAPGRPEGVAVSTDGYCLLVSDREFDRVLRFDALGDQALAFGAMGRLSDDKAPGIVFRKPVGLALAPDGTLLVADRNNDRVERFGLPTGKPASVVPPNWGDDPRFVAKDVLDSASGGTVARSDKAGVAIPPGALSNDLKITVSTMSSASAAQADSMGRVAGDKGMAPASAPVEYGPEGTQFATPVTITVPYDAGMVAASGMSEDTLKVNYWNKDKGDWETLDSTVDKTARTVTAKTPHFSLYQVLGSTGTGTVAPLAIADPTFTFHDAYAFPNPVRGTNVVTIRMQTGLADSVEVHAYDVTGRSVYSSSNFMLNPALDDGNGKGAQYTYDNVWDISGVGSGVYTYVLTAKKAGASDIHKTGRIGVVK